MLPTKAIWWFAYQINICFWHLPYFISCVNCFPCKSHLEIFLKGRFWLCRPCGAWGSTWLPRSQAVIVLANWLHWTAKPGSRVSSPSCFLCLCREQGGWAERRAQPLFQSSSGAIQQHFQNKSSSHTQDSWCSPCNFEALHVSIFISFSPRKKLKWMKGTELGTNSSVPGVSIQTFPSSTYHIQSLWQRVQDSKGSP